MRTESNRVSVVRAVAAYARTAPDTLAVDEPGMALTYRELAGQAAGLQRALREAGVAPGEIVPVAGLSLGDVAVASVAAAGLAVLPYPLDLGADLAARLDLVGARVVVLAGYPAGHWLGDRTVIQLDELTPGGELADVGGGTAVAVDSERHDAVVVLRPDGFGASVAALAERLRLGSTDRVLTAALPHTDVTLLTLLAILLRGGTAVSAGRPVVEGDRLRRIVERHRVTVLAAPPRAVGVLAETAADDGIQLSGLRLVLLLRDRIPRWLPAVLDLVTRRDRELVVAWGAAEAGVIAATGGLDEVLGEPLGEQRIEVGPDSSAGSTELCCVGPSVAAGYVGRPDLDGRHFDTGPDGGRRYRTGVPARVLPDGRIRPLHGRLPDAPGSAAPGAQHSAGPDGPGSAGPDAQHSAGPADPAEVEVVAETWGDVRLARVVTAPDGELVLYVETASGARVDGGALRGYLRGRVPPEWSPARVVAVPTLPVTPSGVVDRARLAAMATSTGPDTPAEPDSGPTAGSGAARILRTVARGLGVANLGLRTNLFEVGATSLEIIRAVAQLETDLELDVDLERLLDAPYVQTLIDQYQETVRDGGPPAGGGGDG
ncbi:non-ribosomal peptide synthetase [Plantactinospora sp. KLBMP9567]|uniref:non-ribosomal peptide synthetase n=1 Tax=Plantactinospora sp. KLBMP9567 TaxID=3085900 RepID=UPI0029829447|nr:non-ribosomal peptide synthetase [Plantactinospora sp. KLBMP9567]MDW5324863.1 non-ribosomal peptide synthetase [Plantactinospora sp. KLBMP9567]